jgi:hypothetical protein
VTLNEAYKNHLCKEYQERQHQEIIDANLVNRPNHGLAHTYRVMIYIDVVIDYFAQHAKEHEFKEFCQNISRDTRQWLRVAAAYSITGRENELSAIEDLKKYDGFRQSSENHLREFLKKHPPLIINEQLQERICHVVRWMGNPAYEHTIKTQARAPRPRPTPAASYVPHLARNVGLVRGLEQLSTGLRFFEFILFY